MLLLYYKKDCTEEKTAFPTEGGNVLNIFEQQGLMTWINLGENILEYLLIKLVGTWSAKYTSVKDNVKMLSEN